MKIEELLKKGKEELIKNNIEDANIIARILLQFTLGISRNELISKANENVNENKQEEYEKAIEKIIEGNPLQYITNEQEFMKMSFYVDENVLIPQPDTEILVEEVIKIAQEENKNKILDLCTGSGCIGISLAKYIPNANITLSDISKNALEVARKNAKANEVDEKIKIIESNMFEKIEEKFDIIVSNPPYIKTDVIKELAKEVQKEPMLALDGGDDGLFFYKEILKEAPKHLQKDGYLCLEIGYDQKEEVVKLAKNTELFSKVEVKQDLSGNDRIIILHLDK